MADTQKRTITIQKGDKVRTVTITRPTPNPTRPRRIRFTG